MFNRLIKSRARAGAGSFYPSSLLNRRGAATHPVWSYSCMYTYASRYVGTYTYTYTYVYIYTYTTQSHSAHSDFHS
jgi:hypothetical protein